MNTVQTLIHLTEHDHFWEALKLEEAKPRSFEDRVDRTIATYRARFLALNKSVNKNLVDLFVQLHRDIMGELAKSGLLTAETFSDATLAAVLEPIIVDFRRDFQAYLQRALVDSAELTMLREQDLLKAVAAETSPAVRAALKLPVDFVSRRVAEVLMQGTLGTGVHLSDAVWAMGEMASVQTSRIIRSGLLAGDDAIKVAKDLEAILVPRDEGKVWTSASAPDRLKKRVGSAIKGIQTKRGTVSYLHLRVARSEMFRAQKMAHVVNVMGLQGMLPFSAVNGMRWVLSNSHPMQDICDSWASEDNYGLGSGVYPPDALPSGHPNDLCYTTSELISPSDFKKRMALYEDQVGSASLLGSLSPDLAAQSYDRAITAAEGSIGFYTPRKAA